MDTTWKNNKRSLFGFIGFLITLTLLTLIGIDGLIKLVIAIVVWFLIYKYLDKKTERQEKTD